MASCEIDQTGQEDLMEKRKRVLNKACIKCKCTQANLVVRGLVYCKPCIQALVVQRFKRSINQVIPPAQAASTVLALGFSGGLGSTLLLDLVAQVLSADSKRTRHHRWERIHVIHVDDSNVNAQQNPRISVQARDIDNALSSYPHLTLVKVPLENAFEGAQSSETPLDALHEYLRSMPTPTAVKDSIQILTRRVLERTALSLGATHLLLGRSMSSLSKALLSNICSGRAFTISDEHSSFCDGLTSFNPLQDVGSKECAASLWWRGLRVISSPIQQPDVANSSTSISELTRAFISGLEKDYPSTVSTIVKTCAKVVPKGSGDTSCRLCARRIQAEEASATSEAIISITADRPTNSQAQLCYACKTMLTSANSRTSAAIHSSTIKLPVWAAMD